MPRIITASARKIVLAYVLQKLDPLIDMAISITGYGNFLQDEHAENFTLFVKLRLFLCNTRKHKL